VLRWLSYGVLEPDDIPEHEHGTCRWIYTTPAWKDWEASAFKNTLLVTGKEGKWRVLLELASLSYRLKEAENPYYLDFWLAT
jgi:hypothetical protein